MATIKYTIISGEAPFTVELTPSLIPVNTHLNAGTFQFDNVLDGNYTLVIVDSNDCIYEKELTINPFVTTTTTTIPSGDSIIVGQVQDESLIFNTVTTNRNIEYEGYPDENIIILYLWLKTYDGKPITTKKIVNYSIYGGSGNTFSFVELSDQVHSEIVQTITGPAENIEGQLILKEGFIETYFQYIYVKNPSIPNIDLELSSGIDWLYTDIPIKNANQYGVTYIDRNNVVMNF